MIKRILFIFGTRPEAIKLAPLINEFQKKKDRFKTAVCITAQHREMLDQVLEFFEIKPDYDLDIMKENQSLSSLTSKLLIELQRVMNDFNPDNVIVQGDTTTATVSALSAFYSKVKVSHIEAGLRSFNKYSPFPEEVNRKILSQIADYHFAPTVNAVNNLKSIGIEENVWHVGNTVIDALLMGLNIISLKGDELYRSYFKDINFSKRIVLITAHRRENFGEPFVNICNAIKRLAVKNSDTEFVYPVHLNPNVQKVVNDVLRGIVNVHLLSPLDYPKFIWIMSKCYMIITDSGGIQEEAPSLGKPILVTRDVTERTEVVDAGVAKLVGNDVEIIVSECDRLLRDEEYYNTMVSSTNPYGDGRTSERVVDIYGKYVY